MTDSTQWNDTDGDGYGDNPAGAAPDACVNTYGTSWQNGTYGCPDGDQDGWGTTKTRTPPTRPSGPMPMAMATATTPEAPYPMPVRRFGAIPHRVTDWVASTTTGTVGTTASTPCPTFQRSGLTKTGTATATTPPIQPDACPGEAGTSSIGLYGCVDDDGDGHANLTDDFPLDPTRWIDSDGDGYDDAEDACPFINGNSTQDRVGAWTPTLMDFQTPRHRLATTAVGTRPTAPTPSPTNPRRPWTGTGTATATTPAAWKLMPARPSRLLQRRPIRLCGRRRRRTSDASDAFLGNPTQWIDTDGDGYGDCPNGTQADACVATVGTSTVDVYGCTDGDGDGASDANDLWPNDATQWFDSDGDGYGDETQGTDGDACPNDFGTSTARNTLGCPTATATGGRTSRTLPRPAEPANGQRRGRVRRQRHARRVQARPLAQRCLSQFSLSQHDVHAGFHRGGPRSERVVHLHLLGLHVHEFRLCGHRFVAGDFEHRGESSGTS